MDVSEIMDIVNLVNAHQQPIGDLQAAGAENTHTKRKQTNIIRCTPVCPGREEGIRQSEACKITLSMLECGKVND